MTGICRIAVPLLGLLLALPALSGALAEGRYSGRSDGSRVGSLPYTLGNSFTGRYQGVYRFTDKSTLRNSENNRSQFKNSFAKRSYFGNRQDRVSKLKQRYARSLQQGRPLPPIPDLDIYQPANRPPRLGPRSDPPLDKATRQEIAKILRAHAARQSSLLRRYSAPATPD